MRELLNRIFLTFRNPVENPSLADKIFLINVDVIAIACLNDMI